MHHITDIGSISLRCPMRYRKAGVTRMQSQVWIVMPIISRLMNNSYNKQPTASVRERYVLEIRSINIVQIWHISSHENLNIFTLEKLFLAQRSFQLSFVSVDYDNSAIYARIYKLLGPKGHVYFVLCKLTSIRLWWFVFTSYHNRIAPRRDVSIIWCPSWHDW